MSKVNAEQHLSLKVNDQKISIPPSCFIPTPDGVKVFLPAGTLPQTAAKSEKKAADVKLNSDKDEEGRSSKSPSPEADGRRSRSPIVPECLLPKDDTCYFEKLQVGVDIVLNIFRFLPRRDLLRYV